MERIDEEYVREILAQAGSGLNKSEFMRACQPDINGGWRPEVEEAWRRYKKGQDEKVY